MSKSPFIRSQVVVVVELCILFFYPQEGVVGDVAKDDHVHMLLRAVFHESDFQNCPANSLHLKLLELAAHNNEQELEFPFFFY